MGKPIIVTTFVTIITVKPQVIAKCIKLIKYIIKFINKLILNIIFKTKIALNFNLFTYYIYIIY